MMEIRSTHLRFGRDGKWRYARLRNEVATLGMTSEVFAVEKPVDGVQVTRA